MITAWDEFGPLRADRDGDQPLPAGPPLLIAYTLLSRRVAAMMADRGMRERNWTRYRIASTVLAEIQSGETWSDRRRREFTGHPNGHDFRVRVAPFYREVLAAAVNDPSGRGSATHPSPRTEDPRPRMAPSGEVLDEDRIAA